MFLSLSCVKDVVEPLFGVRQGGCLACVKEVKPRLCH